MPETPYPPAEAVKIASPLNSGPSDDEPKLDDDLLDAFLPDDEYEPLPESGDFWIEKD